jgi:microcystin-dependent protein
MADPFVGEIRAFPYTFAPLNWATCDGQMLSPSQNQALFAVIGITYGGNGSTTFALPNLQGRSPMDFGAGPGLTQRSLNDAVGSATVSLTTNNFPSHTHSMNAVSNAITDQAAAANHYLSKTPTAGKPPTSINTFQPAPSSGTQLAVDAAQTAGTATVPVPHDNIQPYLPVQLCIALEGEFPVRP